MARGLRKINDSGGSPDLSDLKYPGLGDISAWKRGRNMKIACVGAGPGGLYFAISMKLRSPQHEIVVFERNRPSDAFGWGVVFSDQTMENLRRNDPISAQSMLDELAHWDDILVRIDRDGLVESIRSSGHGFIGIGRRRLLEILHHRARSLGVDLRFESEIEPDSPALANFDLVVASDGVNSKFRAKWPGVFASEIDVRKNHFIWCGVRQRFDAFNFIFKKTEMGWIWAHAYQFDKDTATFIVECGPETFENFGFSDMSQEESCRVCEKIFGEYLGGHSLMTNAAHRRGSAWLQFRRVLCGGWRQGNIVLLGDAAHTAHFSIGSGTKLALEDAIELAALLNDKSLSRDDALTRYFEVRHLEALKLQNAARNSTEWFEDVERYLPFEPMQFAYSLLTRSQRVSHENLRLRDPAWLAELEQWFASRAGCRASNSPAPPMFAPLRLRDMQLINRVAVSPMAMYSAADGAPTDFHLVHYGARALGGAGLVFTEMTCISPEGRITPGCPGLWNDAQEETWRRIVSFVHEHSRAKICLQLGHSGAKGSTRVPWKGIDRPLERGNWPLMAPSAVAWTPDNALPTPMTRADMDAVRRQFVGAAVRGDRAGFDMLELHCAHGYLLSAFISPTQNKRRDEYGGSLENRLRFPIEIFAAIRAAWPEHKPMSVRISAHDWVGDAGVTPTEAVEIARAFVDAGADIIDVSSGQVTKAERPVYGRMFQTPFSDRIRNELHVPTIAVGNIYEIDHVNSILAAGRADICALARPHQMDPNWTIRAAAELKYGEPPLPLQYQSGYRQLATNLARAGQMAIIV
jgi:anthraniloyl-CoA monooxygenase